MKNTESVSVVRVISSVVALTSLIVMFCLLYVWQKNQELKIGYQINKIKKDIERVDLEIEQIETRIQLLKSPDKILARIPSDLIITSGERIVHLAAIQPENPPETELAKAENDDPYPLIARIRTLLQQPLE
ncbi:hypothetical protein KDK77_02860 [bacterium]|nr:hypothetical protein [bacterium]MCP5461773.1 hypothetical protein [bacterium]